MHTVQRNATLRGAMRSGTIDCVPLAKTMEQAVKKKTTRFHSFPRTEPPPPYVEHIVKVFRSHEDVIGTRQLDKGLTSDQVLTRLRDDLLLLGFAVESGKAKADKIHRPVYFGESGAATLKYEVDAYHSEWRCGLEVEAGRAIMGNAVYRDLIQAMVMVEVDHLCIAIPNTYKHMAGGKQVSSKDYDVTVAMADALFGHSRVAVPYGLTVIGY